MQPKLIRLLFAVVSFHLLSCRPTCQPAKDSRSGCAVRCRFSVVHGSFAKKEAGLMSRAEAAEADAAEWRGRADEAERALAEARHAAAAARECAAYLLLPLLQVARL